MDQFHANLRAEWTNRPFFWGEGAENQQHTLQPPASGLVLVLAPHPDDPESVAVTCRLLRERGCTVRYAIVTDSPGGVEDDFVLGGSPAAGTSMREQKIAARRDEQRLAAEAFGLPPDSLVFLGLPDGASAGGDDIAARIESTLTTIAPDMVLMPTGEDTNRTHAVVHGVFRTCAGGLAARLGKPILGLYFEDPKTIQIHPDLHVLFGPESADWKRSLLRLHASQQQRNLRQRGRGLDDHILSTNRQARARMLEGGLFGDRPELFAEVFELELFEPA